MVGSRTSFTGEKAPCGKVADGDRYRDVDDEGLVLWEVHWACGCRTTHHEYHDGSIRVRSVRHDGKVVEDEFTRD
jgi:hypothetical protein